MEIRWSRPEAGGLRASQTVGDSPHGHACPPVVTGVIAKVEARLQGRACSSRTTTWPSSRAYSSVEHMGILAIGVSFGAPAALAGVLLHVMAHAAAKANAFMGAGVFTVKFGNKEVAAMRDGMR